MSTVLVAEQSSGAWPKKKRAGARLGLFCRRRGGVRRSGGLDTKVSGVGVIYHTIPIALVPLLVHRVIKDGDLRAFVLLLLIAVAARDEQPAAAAADEEDGQNQHDEGPDRQAAHCLVVVAGRACFRRSRGVSLWGGGGRSRGVWCVDAGDDNGLSGGLGPGRSRRGACHGGVGGRGGGRGRGGSRGRCRDGRRVGDGRRGGGGGRRGRVRRCRRGCRRRRAPKQDLDPAAEFARVGALFLDDCRVGVHLNASAHACAAV